MHVSHCFPTERSSSDTRPVAISIRIQSDWARKEKSCRNIKENVKSSVWHSSFSTVEEKKKLKWKKYEKKVDDRDSYNVNRVYPNLRCVSDRHKLLKVENCLSSHLLRSECRGSFTSTSRPESFLHCVTVWVNEEGKIGSLTINPHKEHRKIFVCSSCRCPGSNSVSWLCRSCCKSLRSGLKIEWILPLLHAWLHLFYSPIHWHRDAIGAECSPVTTHIFKERTDKNHILYTLGWT